MYLSHINVSLSLSFSLSPFLSLKSISMSSGEDKKIELCIEIALKLSFRI